MPDISLGRDGRWLAVVDRDRRQESYSAKQRYILMRTDTSENIRVSNKPGSVTRL
ncbi:MAG: hypothetical protein M1154_17625 [Gammaproteobacteria bacterium]|nr:hypothetical protein [Gammaproteobacteria bacterium]